MRYILICLSLCLFVSCLNLTGPDNEEVSLHVDLQSGLGGHEISIAVGDTTYFHSVLDPAEPLAGPLDQFTLTIRNENTGLQVLWRPAGSDEPFRMYQSILEPGDSDTHYIGIGLSGVNLQVQTQNRPFYYL